MKLSIVTNVLALVLSGVVGGGFAAAQNIPAGPVGYPGAQFAAGAGPNSLGQGVSYAGCDTCDAYGNSVDPASARCDSCDGSYGGCDACGGFGAYGAGGGYDQCGPHYFDFSVDFLYWKRDDVEGPVQPLSSEGFGGPRRLSINGLDFDEEPGVKLTARLDLGPATIVEAIYFGTFHMTRVDSLRSTDFPPNVNGQIFSLYSNYGLNGVGFPTPAERPDTDFADLHSLTYNTQLNNGEINWRQYWVADGPRITGTYLMGARYVRLTEELLFRTVTSLGSMDNSVATENDLVGFQVGGDAAICLWQGLRIVTEGKAGIYNNRSKSKSRVVATSLAAPENQLVGGNNVAFVGEASIGFVADVLPSLSIRGGYQVLYLDSVTLAGDNFSTDDPFAGPRNAVLVDDSTLLFNGLYGGLEYVW